MRAGVLSYKLCDREFDCEHCLLDSALHGGDATAASSASWAPGTWGPSGYRLFPQDRHFSPAHTWVLDLGSATARLGVDALLAWLLSETTAVKLPPAGTWLDRGETFATLSTKGGKLTLAAPIAGRVLGHNETIKDCPELVVSTPYGAGWLLDMSIEPGRRNKEFSHLLCGPDMENLSRSHLHEFHSRTDALLAARPASVGATMADGGSALTDPRAMLGAARYLKLIQELLT
jgi:glycine cleavage system H protein